MIYIIIVLYNPDSVLLESIVEKYSLMADQVLFCDNTTNIQTKEINRSICKKNKCGYYEMDGNVGIARAQNIGIKIAKNNNANYILFLDQDSVVDSEYLEKIKKEYILCKEKYKNIGCIGPVTINKNDKNHVYTKKINKTGQYIKVSQIMSSGLFIPIDVLFDVGLMEEDLFIDLVDYEWSWRAINKGYSLIVTKNITIFHQLGDGHKKIINIKIGNTNPIRYYYTYRNTMSMQNRDYVPFFWKVKTLIKCSIKIILCYLVYDKKRERLKYIKKGLIDFKNKRYGRIDE
jgi:rhamnosyltransferase